MKRLKAALAALLLFGTGYAHAQCQFKVKGTVSDESDGSPLEFVTVYLVEGNSGANTDSAGRFEIGNVCAGTYTLRLSHVGCKTIEQTIRIENDTVLDLTLPHSANLLESVTIVSEKKKEQIASVSTISGEDLDMTRGGTFAGSLQTLPGVSAVKTGSTIEKPVIHGLFGNRVLLFSNGVRLESQQWGSEHAPEIDPFIASNISVVKGAGSVRYGSDAIGGVILASPAPIRDSAGTGGQLDVAGFSNGRGVAVSGMAEHRFKKLDALAVRLQGTLKRTGNINTPDYYLKNTGMSEYDFSWSAAWKKKRYGLDLWYSQFNSKLAIFSGSHIGNLTDFENALASGEPAETSGFTYDIERPYQNVEHETFKVAGYFLTGRYSKLSASYSRQYNLRQEYDKDVPLDDSLAALNLPELSYELTSHIGDLAWEHQIGRSVKGIAGATGQYAGNTFEGRFFIPNYISRTGALFLMERWTGGKAGIEAGVRYEWRSMDVYINTGDEIVTEPHQYNGLTGTVGASYRFSDSFELIGNLSTAWRPPSVNELYADGLHHGAAAVEIGDQELKEEKASNVSLTMNFRHRNMLEVELTGYHSSFDGFIYLQPEQPPTVIVQGTFPTNYYRQGDASLSGFDLHGKWNIRERFIIDFRGAGVLAVNTTTDEYLPGFPPAQVGGGISYLFRSVGAVQGIKAGMTAEYVTEQEKVPDEEDYVPPPPAYSLFGMYASCMLPLGDNPLSVSLSVDNLFDTAYRDYLNRYRYYADDTGRNITLRLKMTF